MTELSSFSNTVYPVSAADGRALFVFAHLLQELRLDCTVRNGPGLLIRLFLFFSFFFNNTVFLLVNWSVFASLSTPAKQHLPWSYKISIRSFPSAGLSLLHLHGCFSVIFDLCSYSFFWGNLLEFPLKMLLGSPSLLNIVNLLTF